MKKNSITEFELERQDSKIRLKRGINGGGSVSQQEESFSSIPIASQPVSVPPIISAPASSPATGEIEIKSPMIGTFYRAPSPEAANYVEVGAEVGNETVVCIIEAMKV